MLAPCARDKQWQSRDEAHLLGSGVTAPQRAGCTWASAPPTLGLWGQHKWKLASNLANNGCSRREEGLVVTAAGGNPSRATSVDRQAEGAPGLRRLSVSGHVPHHIMLWINLVHPNFRETDPQILLEAMLSGRRSLHESRWVYPTCQTASPGLLCNLLLKSQTSLASQGQVVSRPTGSTRGWPWSLVWVTRAQADCDCTCRKVSPGKP